MILCVAANPSVDRLFTVERLVPGEIHRPAVFVQVPGGKGLNVARAAAALGGRVQAAALLGGHAGRWIAEQLEAGGIELHATWAEAETRSSLSVAGAFEGLTEFYEHGFPVSDEEWRQFARVVAELAPEARWVTLSGSLPAGSPQDGYLSLIPLASTAFDSVEQGIEARPQIVKLNAAEASQQTGLPVTDPDQGLAAARLLHEATGGAAVVTLGEAGAVMVTPEGSGLEGSCSARGSYPVGSGDAFLAGLMVAVDQGAGWEESLRSGLGAGAANAELPGAAILDPDRARRLAGGARLVRRA
jgi:1-phosphofructokinase family hexose kinase